MHNNYCIFVKITDGEITKLPFSLEWKSLLFPNLRVKLQATPLDAYTYVLLNKRCHRNITENAECKIEAGFP